MTMMTVETTALTMPQYLHQRKRIERIELTMTTSLTIGVVVVARNSFAIS